MRGVYYRRGMKLVNRIPRNRLQLNRRPERIALTCQLLAREYSCRVGVTGAMVWARKPQVRVNMNRSRIVASGLFLVFLGFETVSVSAGASNLEPSQVALARRGSENGLQVQWNMELGAPTSIKAPDLGAHGQAFSGGHGLSVRHGGQSADDAIAVLDNLAGVLRVRDAESEFSVLRVTTDFRGGHHARVQQKYEGIRVVGGELAVHFDSAGTARSLNGQYVPDISLSTNPIVSASEALSLAMLDAKAEGMDVVSVLSQPERVIIASRLVPASRQTPVLAYDLTLETQEDGLTGHWRYWIDATSGTVLHAYDNVKELAPGTGIPVPVSGYHLTDEGGTFVTTTGFRSGSTYYLWLQHSLYSWIQFDLRAEVGGKFINNGTSSSWITSVSDRSEISAYENFISTANFYKDIFNRSSYNGAGGHMNLYVHSSDVGASDIDKVWLGDGYTVLDVLSHEWSHCVVDAEAQFVYDYLDSGAFHEGYADLFGTLIEFYSQPDGRTNYPNSVSGTADWLMGEDTGLGRSGGYRALRDLRDPSGSNLSEEEHPSRYKGTYWDPDMEMHVNSTVFTHFFYLLCEGGSGTNDGIVYDVTGADGYPGTNADYYPRTMAYNVLCNRATSEIDYPDMRQLWLDEADANYPAYSSRVRAAWDAVGVSDDWDPTDDAGSNATQLDAPTNFVEKTHGTHFLTSSDPYDWFKVTLSGGTRYVFEGTDGSGDTYGELYTDASASGLVASDNDSGSNSQFRIVYQPSSSKTFYLRVHGNTVGEACQYTLSYYIPAATLVSVDVTGPATVNENSNVQYTCTAYYDDASSVDVTTGATWKDNSSSASISTGLLTAASVSSDSPCRLTATYEGQSNAFDVTILDLPTPMPDFVVTDIQLNPATPTFGKTFTANVTVSNSGTGAGKVGAVYAWTNKTGVASVGESPTKSKSLGTLNPGQTATVAITDLKATVAGSLVFRAFADAQNGAAELDEGNNQATLNYDVRTKPDISVSSIAFNPSTPNRGGVYAATVTVKNGGSSNAAGFTVAVWSHLSGTPTNSNGADATVWVSSLGTNQSFTLPVFTNLPAGTGKTVRTFRVLVDTDGDLDEASESNNASSKTYTPASKPDFVITGITLNPASPAAGGSFSASVTVLNQGYKSSAGGTLDVWADGASAVSPNSANRGDKSVSVTSLAFGAQTIYTVNGLVAPLTGPCTVQATVDSRASVAEVVETNNTASQAYTLAP